MNNKLVLDRGTPQYIWDKNEIGLVHKYVWEKWNTIIDYLYKWKQYYAVYDSNYIWDKFKTLTNTYYEWDEYQSVECKSYLWQKWSWYEYTTYIWNKYRRGYLHYWDKYENPVINYTWKKYNYKGTYKYKYKYALHEYAPYLTFSKGGVYLDGGETSVNGNVIYTEWSFGGTDKTSFYNLIPTPTLTLENVDLSQWTYKYTAAAVQLKGYTESTSTKNDFINHNVKIKYNLAAGSNIKNITDVSTILPTESNAATNRVFFVSNTYPSNAGTTEYFYYIPINGVSFVNGNIVKNVIKVQYNLQPNTYYSAFNNYVGKDTCPPQYITGSASADIGDFNGNVLHYADDFLPFITGTWQTAPYGYRDEITSSTYLGDIVAPTDSDYNPETGMIRQYTQMTTEGVDYSSYEEVSSTDVNAYPMDGKSGNNYYVYDSRERVSGTYLGEVSSATRDAFPEVGVDADGYAYFYLREEQADIPGKLIGTVESSSWGDYPRDGVKDGYYYIYQRESTDRARDELITRVESRDPEAYPDNGIADDDYWYVKTSITTFYEKGEPTGNVVKSTDSTAYPNDKYQDGFWYVFKQSYATTSKGDYIEQVSSTVGDTYPNDGIQDDYWYTLVSEGGTYSKGEETGVIVSSKDAAAYPNNGRLAADGFWYESIEPETTVKKKNLVAYVSANSLDAYPQDGIKGNYWYVYDYEDEPTKVVGAFVEKVYSTYQYEYPINAIRGDYWYVYKGKGILPFTITDAELYGGIKYKSYINTEADWRAGTVSSASIEFTTSVPMVLGDEIQYFKRYSRDNSWSYVDNYIVDEVIKTPYQDIYKVVAYDYITLFDVYVDEWLKTLTYPITIQNLYTQLVSHIQTTSGKDLSVFKTDIGANGSIEVLHSFEGVNITGRQILQFIAEATGRCVGMRSTEDARFIDVQAWGEAGTFDSVPSNRVSLNMSEYEIAAPTRVVVRTTEDDVGGSAGSGTEGYDVVGNPLFYGVSQTTLNTAAAGILSEMTPAHNFHNGTLEMLQDYDIPINSWFRIYAADGITDLGYFLAMGKEFDGKGVKYTCEGKATRDTQASNQNSEIIALLGKYNELKSSIDENSATIVDLTKGQSSITQRVDSISTSVSDLKGNQSSITQTVNSLNSKVVAQGNKVNSLESEINQTAEEISLKVSKNEIISAINLSSESIDISSDKINLTGYITATDLKTGGATTINGSNITTGTISADRINLTGAISWSDLDSFVQEEIEAGGGSVSLPSYIKTSYIGPTEIRSPTIKGNNIQVYNTFQTLNSNGVVSGYMGAARGKDGYGNTTYGVAMSNSWSSNTYDVGDNYIIATNAGIRMESDENSITATENSIHLTAKNGSIYINTPNGKAYYNGVEIGGSSGAVIPVWG